MNSTILSKHQTFSKQLHQFLAPLGGNEPRWLLCYRASSHGLSAGTFHRQCDGKRNTVAIIQRKKFVFGGYSDIPWDSSTPYYKNTSKAFIFSVSNNEGLASFKSKVTRPSSAIATCSYCGPIFGGGNDIYIGIHSNSYTTFGHSYYVPQGVKNRQTILAGKIKFSPDDWEVFYLDPSLTEKS